MNVVATLGGVVGIGLMSFGLWRAMRDASSLGRTSSFALRVQLMGMGLFLASAGGYLISLPLEVTTIVGITLILQGLAVAIGGPWLYVRNHGR